MPKRNSENDGLLDQEENKGSRRFISHQNLVLLFYVVMAVLVGTANRVTFKVRFNCLKVFVAHVVVNAILDDQLRLFRVPNHHLYLPAR